MSDRSHIGRLAKAAGGRHERRIAAKLSKALGEPIRRQVLSGGAWKQHSDLDGDLACLTSPMMHVEIKFRRALTTLAIQRGHKMIDGFIGELERHSGKLLIVITGTEKGKRKNIDWLFSEATHAAAWVNASPNLWHPYSSDWACAKLDDALKMTGIKELFGIKTPSNYVDKSRRKNWESKARLG